MTFVVLGINHRTAPVEIREKVVFAANDLSAALSQLRTLPAVHEAAIVSTCNRTELYCFAEAQPDALSNWLIKWHNLSREQIESCVYVHQDAEAVTHLFGVASG